MNIPNETLKASCPLSDKSARAAVEAGIRMGLVAPPGSPFIHAVKPGPIPKPDHLGGFETCPECGQRISTRKIAGDRHFVFHRVSEFPQAAKCGNSGARA